MRNDAINGKVKKLILLNDKEEPNELIQSDAGLNQASTMPKPRPSTFVSTKIENPTNPKEVFEKSKRKSKVNNQKLFASNLLFKLKKRETAKSIED
jgi:hypothetical protein